MTGVPAVCWGVADAPTGVRAHLQGTALHRFPGHLAHHGAPMSHNDVISVGPLPSVSTGLGSPSSLCPWCPVEWGTGRRPRQLLLNQHMFGGVLRPPCLCAVGEQRGEGLGLLSEHSQGLPAELCLLPSRGACGSARRAAVAPALWWLPGATEPWATLPQGHASQFPIQLGPE